MKKYFAERLPLVISCLLCISLFLTSLCLPGKVQVRAAGQTTLASLDYSYANLYDTETEQKYIRPSDPKALVSGGKFNLDLAGKYGSKSSGYKFTQGNGLLFASVNNKDQRKLEWSGDKDRFKDKGANVYAPVITAGKKNPWDTSNLPYFEARFSTKGYEKIHFSVSIGATKKAPKSYRLAYRIGTSGTYSVLSGASSSLTLTKNKEFMRMSATLPDAAKNSSSVTVKIYASSATTVEGGSLKTNPTSGKIGINHILVQGEKIKKPTASATPKRDTGKNTKIHVGKAKISKVTRKKKKVSVTVKALKGVSGYQVQIAGDKKFKKKVKSLYISGKKAVFKKWKQKKCYVRVRAFKNSTGKKKVYGKWCAAKKVTK